MQEEQTSAASVGGAASPFLGIQNVLASSVLSTVMENSASSSTGFSPSNGDFCSIYEIHTDSEEKNRGGAGKEHMEKVLEEYLQKGRDVQKRLHEATKLHEQQKANLRLIADLQTKLMEVQLERDALQDARQKESQSQENVKIQLKNTSQELEAVNQLREEMLSEADRRTEQLKKMLYSHKEVMLELRSILKDYEESTGKKLCEYGNITNLHIHNMSTAFADVLGDLDSEASHLKGKASLMEEQLDSLRKDSQAQSHLLCRQYQNRVEQLMSEHEQEVAALNDKASGARSYADSIQSQVEIIQEQTRTQNSVHARQVSHLESMVSQLHSELREVKRMYENKLEDLEKQLHLAHSEKAEAQTAQDKCSQESGNLKDRIHQLLAEFHKKKEIELTLEKEWNKRFWDWNTDNSIAIDHLRKELDTKNKELQRMENTVREMRTKRHRQMEHQVDEQMAAIKETNESFGRISSLSVQLESKQETLRKVKEDLTAKQIDAETAEKAVSNLMAHLQERERALEAADKEIKKLHSQLGSRMEVFQHLQNEGGCLHSVQSECETLKLQLLEKEKIIEILQKQINNVTQVVNQHSQTAGAMEAEKFQLVKEINDWKLKVEELKISKDGKEARIYEMVARLSELELEKLQLVNTCSERLHALQDMKLEKAQLLNELQASRSELTGLAEGFEHLKRDYQDKTKEMENTANQLKKQLKSAQGELEQTRAALKTMEGSHGHAMKIAVGMWKKITAKRGQIDALQSKIKFLEEALTNAVKEKGYLRDENSQLSQELSYITAEKNKIAGELEILRSRDKRLKAKVSKMDKALDKACLQFAECQCIIQCQEQEAVRLRLQHTLDVKELQGPGYSSASAPGRLLQRVPRSHLPSAAMPPFQNLVSSASYMPSKPGVLKEEPLQDLKRILQELTSSDSDIPTVDPGKGESHGGRKSSLATMRNASETAAGDSAPESIMEKAPCGRDPSSLHTADLQFQDVTLPFTSLGGASIFSAATCVASSPRKVSREERYREKSPVHLLLTTPPDALAAGPTASPEHGPYTGKAGCPEGAAMVPQLTSQPKEINENTSRRLQNKVESLQILVELLQIKNQATSSMIRTQEMKTEKAKSKKKMLPK